MISDKKQYKKFLPYERKLNIWEKNHLEDCKSKGLGLFENKDVIEFGGITPASVAADLGAKSWTNISLSAAKDLITTSYKVIKANIETYDFQEDSYDTCISTNCLEHVHKPEKALLNTIRSLKQGGYMSILFGPVWSCHIGHHLFIKDPESDGRLTFNDDIIPPWGHLLFDKNGMQEYLLRKQFTEKQVTAIINQVYNSDIFNRLFFDEYDEIFNNIINKLSLKVIESRNWHQAVYPDSKTLKILSDKYNKKNFGVISYKFLLSPA